MDLTTLAEAFASLLAPALPHLMQGGQDLVAQAGKELSHDSFQKLKKLWKRLSPRIEEDPSTKKVVEAVARKSDDGTAQGALQFHLREILAADSELARDVLRFVEELPAGASWNAVVRGRDNAVAQGAHAIAVSRGVVIGGDVQGTPASLKRVDSAAKADDP